MCEHRIGNVTFVCVEGDPAELVPPRAEERPFKDVPTGELQKRQQAHYETFACTGDRSIADLSMRELRELNLRGLA